MFSIKQNECVGFESIWKVKKVYNATSAQTTEFNVHETSTSTSLSRTIETQTDEVEEASACNVDMNKLSDWLLKIYPRVSKELNESVNSHAFKNYKLIRSSEQPLVKLVQTLRVQENSEDDVFRVSTLSWNSTGNTLAISCNKFHKTWCYHPGAVFLYTFNRYDKMSDTPTKRLTTEACVSIIRFHPTLPCIIAAGTQSGDIIVWNSQHEEGDNTVCRISAHEEQVTHMAWISDIDAKAPLLASSSLDGYLILWNFNQVTGSLAIKHKYQVKSPVLSKLKKVTEVPEEISKKIVRGIVTFDFSPYVPDMFIVGAEGGLLVQCSLLGTVPLKGSTKDIPISDPVYKYFNPHEAEIHKISFSPNRKEMFLTSGSDGEIRIYILDQDEPCKVIFLDNPLLSINWVPFHEKIITGCGSSGIIEIFKLLSGERIEITIKDYVDTATLTQMELNRGRMSIVATGTDKGLVQIWTVPWNLYNCIC